MNRDINISGSFNSRDLGGYSCGAEAIAWRRVIRSGGLSRVDQAGKQTLKDLGITRVIDLRRPAEREAEPDPFVPEDGIELVEVSLFDELDPLRLPAADVLLDHYIRALKTQGAGFAIVLRAIISSPDAVLFHCTAGKDRTGLIAAMLLALAGVDRQTIVADYAMTAERIGPLWKLLEEKVESQGFNLEDYAPMLACKPETMEATFDWLEAHYQDAWGYMQAQGFTAQELHKLRAFLGLERAPEA